MSVIPSCTIHKHQQCNGIFDCDQGEDEKLLICQETTIKTCKRAFTHKYRLPIPLAWLRDGTEDCLNGIDEKGDWPQCGTGPTRRFVVSSDEPCDEVFLCSGGQDTIFREVTDLCNGYSACTVEDRMCQKSYKITPTLNQALTVSKYEKVLLYCLPGMESLQNMKLAEKCLKKQVNLEGLEIFGVESTFTLHHPDRTMDCHFTFGEIYVILSCIGYCKESTCPLTTRNTIEFDSCPDQFPSRIYTIVNNDYLSFVVRSGDSYVKNSLFLCKNERCVTYDKVCNVVNDCGDGSDEELCTNGFECHSKEQFIPITEKCDGSMDCSDFSDECNSECGRELISSSFLEVLCWSLALLAIALNIFSIYQIFLGFVNEATSLVTLQNKMMISVINFGDLLIGVHLINIAVMDTVVYREDYCLRRLSWLSSNHCAIIGVISTIGYEISLVSMTTLSLIRLVGMRSGIRVNRKPTTAALFKMLLILLIIIMISTTIAIVPLVPKFEDFFVNGMTYKTSVGLFIGAPGKLAHLNILQERYRKPKEKNLKWKIINGLVDEMFSNDYGGDVLGRKKLEFYGNDGVCLFKFFVTSGDPQRIYVWIILTANIICLMIMSLCYIIINTSTKARSRILTHEKTKTGQIVKRRNRKLQQKISFIIATDLACWLPVAVAACLHSAEVIDATPYYSTISIVFLPINSVINPIVYDPSMSKALERLYRNILDRLPSNPILAQNKIRPTSNANFPDRIIAIELRDMKKIRRPPPCLATSKTKDFVYEPNN